MKTCYENRTFRPESLALIEQCNGIIEEYRADGLLLTLRQLYYQLVSRDIIPNKTTEYKRLGSVVNDGRLAGLIDWSAIEDRTRNLQSVGHWESPADIIESSADWFRVDKWQDQSYRVEVWIEKEALAGVFESICTELDVPYFSCRGYNSQSEMWGAAMRFVHHIQKGQSVRVLHFGDHDPSGIDMTRDIEARLEGFVSHHEGHGVDRLEIVRVALNIEQVRAYNPPENPAKTTDTRFTSYAAELGESSWELDALNPRVLADLVREQIELILDQGKWAAQVERENRDRALLTVASRHWHDLEKHADRKWRSEITDAIDEE